MTPERLRQIEELYHSAQERAPADRSTLLAQAEPELRREVEALLAQDAWGGKILDSPAWEAAPSLLGQPGNALLTPGTRIGLYKIEAVLGVGGMGVVYRALDTKLNRLVAIKLLSDDLVDAAARRRFQREAQMASSLNHPHILTVHDAGELEGRQYLVTEFVDGGTLKDWARTEKRSWRQIVELLVGVADGLAAAHGAHILHRDIKPGNILIARNGYGKLADFGLAKLVEGTESEATRTLTEKRTRAGVILGTVAYMSPEQASGQKLDARSDVFSFGVVLYEMLAGRRPFSGATDLEVLKTINHGTPEPLGDAVPLALRMLVDKALEKDRAERYQMMREMVVDLRRLVRQKVVEVAPSAVVKTRRNWPPWAAVAVVAALAAGVGLREIRLPVAAPENPLANAQFTRFTDFSGSESDAVISPDGKFVAFVADRDGPSDIWLSQVGTGRFFNLTQGREDGLHSTVRIAGFSPDGSEIWLSGSAANKRLRLIPLMGGTPRPFLADHAVNVAWSPDGAHLVYHTFDDGDPMFVADHTGANARRILINTPDVHNHYPIWSPDGQWIYFVRGRPATNELDLWRIPSAGGEPERLTHHNNDVAYPTPIDLHTVLYVAREENGSGPWLWAVDVDRKVTRRVSFGLEQYTSLAASADGHRMVATVANPSASLWSLPILDRPAEERDVKPFPLPTVRALAPRFGGTSLFYLSSCGTGDGLWRHRENQTTEIWKGAEGALLEPPAVSPDGRRVAVVLRKQGRLRLHVISADGAELQPLTEAIDVRGSACWSPDGQWIVSGGNDATGAGLYKIPIEGGAPVRLIAGPALDPVWSPDGNLIVYEGPNVNLSAPLMAVRPDGTAVELPPIKVLVNGERTRFLPTGKGLVYMQGFLPSHDFWLLDLDTKRTHSLTHLSNLATMRTFDISPDGKQIVFDRLRDNSDIVLIDLPRRP
jgi:serine/threonine protein kinase/Tol biopolymer transport system component